MLSRLEAMPADEPTVSVICPVYNDPEGIELTLDSLVDQTYPDDDHEILPVDNNSDDATRAVIDRYVERYEHVHGIEEQKQGQQHALNAGIRHARGDVLAFIDADMTVERDWLAGVANAMADGEIDYLGCAVEIYIPDGEATLTACYNAAFGFSIRSYLENSHFSGSGCLVVRRDVFDAVGLFGPAVEFSFDREFGERVHRAGFTQHFAPDLTMYHPARSSLWDYLEKAVRTGRGEALLAARWPCRFERQSYLSPQRYLPPHPRRSVTRTSDITSSPTDHLGFFALEYLSKLFRAAGGIRESIRQRWSGD
jgi:glycosyltransferase involved in cell wall biosynthesis